MSKLHVRSTYAGEILLNVTRFSSPIFGTMLGAQTKTKAVYFPIKAQQPEIEFQVQFNSYASFTAFQNFIRTHQKNALTNDTDPGVTLYWPERGILNWTGLIKNFNAGAERFVYAPTTKFVVDLVDSLVSRRTMIKSRAPIFDTVYGLGMPDGVLSPPKGGAGGGVA